MFSCVVFCCRARWWTFELNLFYLFWFNILVHHNFHCFFAFAFFFISLVFIEMFILLFSHFVFFAFLCFVFFCFVLGGEGIRYTTLIIDMFTTGYRASHACFFTWFTMCCLLLCTKYCIKKGRIPCAHKYDHVWRIWHNY